MWGYQNQVIYSIGCFISPSTEAQIWVTYHALDVRLEFIHSMQRCWVLYMHVCRVYFTPTMMFCICKSRPRWDWGTSIAPFWSRSIHEYFKTAPEALCRRAQNFVPKGHAEKAYWTVNTSTHIFYSHTTGHNRHGTRVGSEPKHLLEPLLSAVDILTTRFQVRLSHGHGCLGVFRDGENNLCLRRPLHGRLPGELANCAGVCVPLPHVAVCWSKWKLYFE